ncbi:MAG: hypothetical protein K6U14_01005 [Firmicutes bacterium]|nr:hypothetical protein [Alicyclobacillaceae bacterium]MCL6496197.1 hypothetical protein [Bacillota bacterium]
MDPAWQAVERYLDEAERALGHKYRGRRASARLRRRLLADVDRLCAGGMAPAEAAVAAMERLGSPKAAVEAELATGPRATWVTLLQAALGLLVTVVSLRTQYLPGFLWGRLVAAWGIVATGVAYGWGDGWQWRGTRLRMAPAWWRGLGLGAASGLAASVAAVLPWVDMPGVSGWPWHLKWGLTAVLAVGAGLMPWMASGYRVAAALEDPTTQSGASLAAAGTAAALWASHPGAVPPPCFDWAPWLVALVGYAFFYGVLRLYAGWRAVRQVLGAGRAAVRP